MLWAFDQPIFPASNKFVLVALANFCIETGKSYPGMNTLCQITSLQEDTIRKALTKLVADGVISDTGLTTGSTGRIKVYQLPEPACEIPRKTGVLKQRGIPEQSPANTRAIPDLVPTPIMVTGTGTVNSNRFSKPDIDEVKAKAVEMGMPATEGEKFFDYYESNGWRVGKVPMKKWTSALANWKRNWLKFNPQAPVVAGHATPGVLKIGRLTFTKDTPPLRTQFGSDETFQTYMTEWRKRFGGDK